MANNTRSVLPLLRATRAQNMDAYDKLPKAVRAALREGSVNWSAIAVRKYMRKHKLRAAEMVVLIKQRGREEAYAFAERNGLPPA